MEKKEVILFGQVESYLRQKQAGSRIMDTLEDIRERISSASTAQERRALIDQLEILLNQTADRDNPQADTELEEKKRELAVKVKKQLNASHQTCVDLAKREIEAGDTISREFIQDFRGLGNVEAHEGQMETRQKFHTLVLREKEKLEHSMKAAFTNVAEQVVEEYEHALKRICGMFEREEEPALHAGKKEIYKNVLSDYDSFLEVLKLKGENLCPDDQEILTFSEKCGKKLESIAVQKKRVQTFLQWLPFLLILLVLAAIYVVGKIIKVRLLEKGIDVSLPSDAKMTMIKRAIVAGVIGILYYFYVKMVNRRCRKKLNIALQAYIQPETERFIKEYSVRDKLLETITEYISEVERQYAGKYQWLFNKLEPARTGGGEDGQILEQLKQEIKALY